MTTNIHPTIAGALRGFMPAAKATPPKRNHQGDTTTVVFLGFDLTVELDGDGNIEGLVSQDGSDCYCAFQDWAMEAIDKLVMQQHKQDRWDAEYQRGEDRHNARMET